MLFFADIPQGSELEIKKLTFALGILEQVASMSTQDVTGQFVLSPLVNKLNQVEV